LDTAIIVGVGVIMGSVVAIALVFGKTVLGVAWTGNGAKRVTVVESGNKDNIFQQHMQDKNDVSIKKTSASNLSKADGKQISSQVEKTKDLETLLNKEVTTCDNVAIGCISALQNGLMFISCTPLNIKYEIPTYFVRQYDQNIVLVDISARDLEHYRPQLSF
jgi:hypothetical protein